MQGLLCLRCSEKDKAVLLYFSLGLDCSVCILESLFHTNMGFMALRDETKTLEFCYAFLAEFEGRMSVLIGSPEHLDPDYVQWNGHFAHISAYVEPTEGKEGSKIVMDCLHTDRTYIRVFIEAADAILVYNGFNSEKKHRFQSDMFDWFMPTCVDAMVNLFRKLPH